MRIGDREIGPSQPVYIIAELGVNHDGSPERAMQLVDAAHQAGADAIKLQYFETDRLMSRSAKLAAYQKAAGETDPIAMLRRLELRIDDMGPIVDRAHSLGMHAIVTVFSTELVDLAERLPWDAYKTASPDIVHRPLLERLMATGKPLIVSTGASTIDEVRIAERWLARASERLALLHCVSCYPVAPEDATIAAMIDVARVAACPIGYSDHTPDEDTGALAAQCGAAVLEKHLTYSNAASGPDHRASLEPHAFGRYVRFARRGWGQRPVPLDRPSYIPTELHRLGNDPRIGDRHKRVLACERDVRTVSRQSIVAARALAPGHIVEPDDLTIKRPGTGFLPFEIDRVLGHRVERPVEADTVILPEDVA